VFAIRHPAMQYVQGINDLAAVFIATFVECEEQKPIQECEKCHMTKDRIAIIEADTFFCLSALISSIQINYTPNQPGIQQKVFKLSSLTQRIDNSLYDHLNSQSLQFLHFCFRWLNCLLLRELNFQCSLRLFDTLLSCNSIDDFIIYLCVSFLCRFSSELQSFDFQELIVFLQNLPTESWTETNIEMLCAQAHLYSQLYPIEP